MCKPTLHKLGTRVPAGLSQHGDGGACLCRPPPSNVLNQLGSHVVAALQLVGGVCTVGRSQMRTHQTGALRRRCVGRVSATAVLWPRSCLAPGALRTLQTVFGVGSFTMEHGRVPWIFITACLSSLPYSQSAHRCELISMIFCFDESFYCGPFFVLFGFYPLLTSQLHLSIQLSPWIAIRQFAETPNESACSLGLCTACCRSRPTLMLETCTLQGKLSAYNPAASAADSAADACICCYCLQLLLLTAADTAAYSRCRCSSLVLWSSSLPNDPTPESSSQ